MKAFITGASSGIGRDIARVLAERGYDLIITARRADRLEELANALSTHVDCIAADLSSREECERVFEQIKNEDIDVFVCNAGFGLCGAFDSIPLDDELRMIELNVCAVHILNKLFVEYFKARGSGYILNVASAAGFMAGPNMATYYATKNYVLRLSQAISEELRAEKAGVSISVLCPGPVDTEFNRVANVRFAVKGLSSERVARYAVKGMFKRKTVIIPGGLIKVGLFFRRFCPERLLLKISYRFQKRKISK